MYEFENALPEIRNTLESDEIGNETCCRRIA
jgi:hypothetical protein